MICGSFHRLIGLLKLPARPDFRQHPLEQREDAARCPGVLRDRVADGCCDQRHDQLGKRGEGGLGRVGGDTPQRVAEQPGFLATTAASAALAVTALLRWGEPGAMAMVGRRRALCARHVRRHGDLQRAPEQRACRGRSRKPRGRLAVGALSDGLDVVEPRADGVIHGGVRAVHCGDCGKVLTLLSVRDNCLAPVLRKSLQ